MNYIKFITPIFRFTNSSYYIFSILYNTILPLFTILLVVLFYFMYNNFVLGLIFLIGNLLIFIYIYYITTKIIKGGIKYEKETIKLENNILEMLVSVDKVVYRGLIDDEINHIENKSNNLFKCSFDYYKDLIYENIIVNTIIFITIFLCLYQLIRLFYNKTITSTLFITFITILLLYRDFFTNCINEIGILVEMICRTLEVSTKFNDINFLDSNKISKTDKPKLNYDIIKFENITFKFAELDNYIYKDFSLELKTNDIIGIIGLSGNGKSTFAKILIKAYKYEGNIYIDNVNVQNIDTKYLRKNIIYVSQNSKLFNKTVMNNILYGCKDTNNCNEYLKEIMKYPKIIELFKNIDFKNKSCGLGGENLSGGQRQVINIINGLITPSKIIILDEPTNGLDIELKKEIIEIIKYFKKTKKCIIIISHDSDIMKIFNETIEIEKFNS